MAPLKLVARSSWPSVRREKRSWATKPDARGSNGARPNRADRELTEIEVEIPARISTLSLALAPETTAAAEDAARAIASLDTRAEHLGGLSDLLVRTEAVASSKIEHVYADMDDIARATVGTEATRSAQSTVAASEALRVLTRSVDQSPVTAEAILIAHQELLKDDLLERTYAGRYRTMQNWIGGSDFSPRTAVHIPPPDTMVEPLMDDLIAFANRDDLSVIGQAAVVHAQFESIHPFTDGNGRVGRALIGAVLRRRKATRSVTVPVAAAMLADVDAYFDRLKDYRDGNVDALVTYVAHASVNAAEAAQVSVDHLAMLPQLWQAKVHPRAKSSASKLINGLLQTPILDLRRAQLVTGSAPARTLEAIARLVDEGVLDEITGRSRNRVWVATDVMTELSELEDRIGLRSQPSQRWQ